MASREDVYEAWIRVKELEKKLEKARAEHKRLAREHYRRPVCKNCNGMGGIKGDFGEPLLCSCLVEELDA